MADQKKEKIVHEPVLKDEVVRCFGFSDVALLNISDKRVFIDATVGAGGHSVEFVKRGCFVLGIDEDLKMLKRAEINLKEACPPHKDFAGFFKLAQGNYRNVDVIARENGVDKVNGILYDLGLSIFHYLDDKRGFSFQDLSQPLDMRLGAHQGVLASDLLNSLPKKELTNLFLLALKYNEANRISDGVINRRKEKRIITVGDFVEIVKSVLRSDGHINIATRPMLALRIAVNSEISNLEESLPKAFDLLLKGGVLAVISFHSTEDRVVKKYFRKLVDIEQAELITKKPIVASESELMRNPLSRSAKLRVIIKN